MNYLNSMKHIYLVLLLLGTVQVSLACSCIIEPLDKEVKKTPTIVVGKVLDKGPLMVRNTPIDLIYTYHIQVQYYYKGENIQKVITLNIIRPSSACGMELTVGETYIIFAGKSDEKGRFKTNHCTHTGSISRDDKIITRMDKLLVRREP